MKIKGGITQNSRYEELWFFCTALRIIATDTNAKFKFGDGKVMRRTKSYFKELSISRANNSSHSNPIRPIIESIRNLIVIYILTKFGADWLIIVDAKV